MMTTTENPQIKEIIHNIAEDFRFSGEHEKYAQLFYAADAEEVLDQKMVEDMIEYIKIAQEELERDLAWRSNFLSENPQIEEKRMLATMQTIENEYKTLLAFLMLGAPNP